MTGSAGAGVLSCDLALRNPKLDEYPLADNLESKLRGAVVGVVILLTQLCLVTVLCLVVLAEEEELPG